MSVDALFKSFMDFTDALVELYLGHVIKPFLKLHEHFYGKLNSTLRELLDKHDVPTWFTANFITYARTAMVIPTVLLLAEGHSVLPSLIVFFVDFGDFLDGVVARYWIDQRKAQEKKDEDSPKHKGNKDPGSSDDDSYEVVNTGSPHAVPSWTLQHRSRCYGGFVDAVCDKAYVVPCWIFVQSRISGTAFGWFQYVVLWCLVLAETSSGCIRFRAYFTSSSPAPTVQGLDFSTSAVKADHIGKAKQTFEMVGTSLYILPTRFLGLFLLAAAVPLAYESVRRKVKKRVMYVPFTSEKVDATLFRTWMQVKAMGSHLIVGVVGENKASVKVACAFPCVDRVVAEAPLKVDLHFMETHNIDYVVVSKDGLVTEQVMSMKRCLILKDGIAKPMQVKEEHQD